MLEIVIVKVKVSVSCSDNNILVLWYRYTILVPFVLYVKGKWFMGWFPMQHQPEILPSFLSKHIEMSFDASIYLINMVCSSDQKNVSIIVSCKPGANNGVLLWKGIHKWT